MIGSIYFFVIIFSNAIGAISGMGGGVIIKPIFDFIGADPVEVISFYSTMAVFTMSIVSIIKRMKSGTKFNWRIIIFVAIGAMIGGCGGNIAFNFLLDLFEDEAIVKLVQITITIITLIFAFIYSKYNFKSLKLNHFISYITCGIILGFVSSLLDIGGGPINVALFMLVFSMGIKEATVYSICTIFFSQLSKLFTITISGGLEKYNLSMLLYIIPAAIIGALIGVKASKVLSEDKVAKVFRTVIIIVCCINIYNGLNLY